jgi:hypothetical protein
VYFKDLLFGTEAQSTLERPISVDEAYDDFLIVMLIVNGRPQDAIHLSKSYERSKRLYKMMEKYRFEMHMPWISSLCAGRVAEKPLDALFLACTRPVIDITLARLAISNGFAKARASEMYDPLLFSKLPQSALAQSSVTALLALLNPTNTTVQVGLEIGFKGLMAFHKTFANTKDYCFAINVGPTSYKYDSWGNVKPPKTDWKVDWNAFADAFVTNAKAVEMQIRSNVRIHHPVQDSATASIVSHADFLSTSQLLPRPQESSEKVPIAKVG